MRYQTSFFAVGERRIQTTPDFREMWERDFPIADLSVRRYQQ
jgi:hypothetical protein